MRPSALKQDLMRVHRLGRGGSLRRILICLKTPGAYAVVILRFGQWLLRRGRVVRILLDPVYWILSLLLQLTWGITLSRRTQVGPGLYISHFGGIMVSPHVVIGRNCSISHGVTLGVSGQGDKQGCPVIGDNVYIATGACVFGKIRVGNNVKIGANAVIHKDVPDDCLAVAAPGFSIRPHNRTI